MFVFGESEVRYLESLDHDTRMNVLASAFSHDIPCVLITGGWNPPVELLDASERYHVPVLRTAVAPSFTEIGQLAAIAAIRTALNYFLGREITQERAELERDTAGEPQPDTGSGGSGGRKAP